MKRNGMLMKGDPPPKKWGKRRVARLVRIQGKREVREA